MRTIPFACTLAALALSAPALVQPNDGLYRLDHVSGKASIIAASLAFETRMAVAGIVEAIQV